MAVRLKSSNALHALHGRDLDPIIADTRLSDGSGINLSELSIVTVSYDAIPEGFLEIDFFGAKTDAYPRAIRDRIGFSQAAHGGACFRTSAAQKNQRTEVHSGRFRQYLNCHPPRRHHRPLL